MSINKNYQSAKGTCKVTFSYPASAAEGVKTIQVLGDFNNWDVKVAPKMKKSKDEFSATVELAAGKIYEFRYLLDGNKWDNDFNADNYIPAPYAGVKNSVLVLDAVVTKAEVKENTKKSTPVKAKSSKVEKPTEVKKEKALAVKPAKSVEVKAAPAQVAKKVVAKTTKTTAAPKEVKTVSAQESSKKKPAVKK